jgi:hypothetical protein
MYSYKKIKIVLSYVNPFLVQAFSVNEHKIQIQGLGQALFRIRLFIHTEKKNSVKTP